MLSSLNLMSTLSEKLLTQQEGIQSKVQALIDGIEIEAGVLTVEYSSTENQFIFDYDEYSRVQTMLDTMVNNTVICTDGYLLYLLDEQTIIDNTVIHRYYDAMHDDALCLSTIVETLEGHLPSTFILEFNGWDPIHHDTQRDKFVFPLLGYLSAQSLSNTLLIAIDLCSKGALTPANFKAAIETSGMAIQNEVAEAVDTIISRVSGTTAFEQASGLMPALQDILASARSDNISVDSDGNIDFHTTEFSIGASILIDVGSVIQTAASVVSLIVSYFAPVFGAVFSIVGTALSGLYQYLNQAIGNDWQLSREQDLDNSSFSVPFVSGVFDVTRLTGMPSKLLYYTQRYGYLRSENAFFTIYSWCNKATPNSISLEIFPNVNVEYRRNWDVGVNGLTQNICNAVDYSTRSFTAAPSNVEHTNITYWFAAEGDTFSPAEIPQVQQPEQRMLAFDSYQNKWCSYSFMYQFAFLAYRTLFCYYGSGSSSISGTMGPEDSWFTANNYDFGSASEATCLQYIQDYLMFFYNESRPSSDPSIIPILQSWQGLGDNWSKYAYGCIMCVYKAILRLRVLNRTKYDYGFVNDFFTIFNTVLNMSDDSNVRDLRGLGYAWSCSPFFSYSTSFLAAPPREKYSLATRLFATGAVVIATSVIACGLSVAAKKKIAFKAENRRQSLDALKAKYQQSGSYNDWNTWRKASNKYNRTYGLLTGTRYDMANAWYNETRTNVGTNTSLDTLPSVMTQTEEGQLALDLHPVIDLIYRPEL